MEEEIRRDHGHGASSIPDVGSVTDNHAEHYLDQPHSRNPHSKDGGCSTSDLGAAEKAVTNGRKQLFERVPHYGQQTLK